MTGDGTTTNPYIPESWAEIVEAAAISGAYTQCPEGLVIDLNDIENPSVVFDNNVFDGNGVIIKNMYTDKTKPIRIKNSNPNTVVLRNTNFIDFKLTNTDTKITESATEIHNCVFKGRMNENNYIFGKYNGGVASRTKINNSYIDIYAPDTALFGNVVINSNQYNHSFAICSNCIIRGTYLRSTGANANILNVDNCLIDAEFYKTGTESYKTVTDNIFWLKATSFTGGYNGSEASSFLVKKNDFSVSGFNGKIITEEQMKDAEYLESQGFPIIIP